FTKHGLFYSSFYLLKQNNIMNKINFRNAMRFAILVSGFVIGATASAQSSSKDKKLVSDAAVAKNDFVHTDGPMKNLFSTSYGYVILPNVGKGAIGIGGA